jgi:hypothetical protein
MELNVSAKASKTEAPSTAEERPLEKLDLIVDWQGKQYPVLQHHVLARLFKHRSQHEIDELKLAMLVHGQFGRCLLYLVDGKAYIVDGHDTLKAYSQFQRDGTDLKQSAISQFVIAFDVYEPKKTEEPEILAELMAYVIRLKNLQTAVTYTDTDKQSAVLKYLILRYSHGVFPTDRWVAEECGCSGTWVGHIRERAVAEGKLIAVAEYTTRNGKPRKAVTNRSVFAPRDTIPISAGHAPVQLEDDVVEQEEAALAKKAEESEQRIRAAAEAEADRLIKEAEEKKQAEAKAAFEAEEKRRQKAEGVEESIQEDELRGQDGPAVDELPSEVVEILQTLEEIEGTIRGWILSSTVKEAVLAKVKDIADLVADSEAEEPPNIDRSRALGFVAQWNNDHGHLEEEDLPWLYDAGIVTVNADDYVSMIDKEQFAIMLAKLGPVVKRFGGNPAALDTVLDTEAKPKRKKS